MDREDLKKIESLKKQKVKADKKGNFKEEADICNYLGEIYARCDRYDDAIEEHKRELFLNETLDDRIGVAVAQRKLGECFCGKRDFQTALKLHKKYLNLARKCNNALEEQRALATIGKTYLDQRDLDVGGVCRKTVSEAAETAFTQSLAVCERLKPSIGQAEYLDMKARLYLNLGLVQDDKEKAELSNDYLEKALTICKNEQLLDVLYLVQCCLGDAYVRQGRHDDASRSLDVAAGTARKMKNKQLESEAMYSNALIAVQRDDFSTARHLLKKSHKLAHYGSEWALKVVKCYQTVRKIEQAVRESRAADFEDWDALIPVFDRLGDLFAEIGLYKPAVKHYQNMLSASISAGRDKKDLAVIHVSIAETLKDDKQYEKAITHYRKEIACRTDAEQDQICNSQMSIGLLQEQAGCSYNQVQIAYVDAFNAAKKAKNLKLQVRCLNYLIELFKVNKADKLQAKVEDQMTKLCHKHRLGEADLDQEDSQEDSQGVEGEDDGGGSDQEEEIVMSDLTESEDETEQVNATRTLRAVRRSKSYTKKVTLNEFGETPLHKACIAGNMDKVNSCLAEGQPLNVEDNNGWTPLHEAANNDHPEIVHLLLDHGAKIDHRGGRGCDGLTPLLDAASAGNFDIMMLLIDRGANINAKDDHQMKAVDHLLAFREGSGELDREAEVQYRNILQILRERDPGYRSKHSSASVGLSQRASGALVPDSKRRSTSASTSSSAAAAGSQRRSRNDIIMQSDSDSDDGVKTRHNTVSSLEPDSLEDDAISYTNPHLQDKIPDPDRNASETYRRTIAGVGRSGCQPSQQSKSSSSKPKEKPALLKETEMVDDWLVEDMQPVKRRKVDPSGFTSTMGTRTKRATDCDSPSDRTMLSERVEPSQGSSSRKKKRPLSIDSSESENENTAGVDAAGDNVDKVVANRLGGFSIVDSDFDDRNSDLMGSDNDDVRIMFEDVDSDNNAPSISQVSSISNCSFLKSRLKKKKPKQSKLTGFVQKTTGDTSSENVNHAVGRSVIHTEKRTTSANVVPEKPGTCVLKVKVQIKGDVFFIPVIESNGPRTFAWLAEEAAVRYYRKCGLKPNVTLGTTDGAHFSPDDIVSLMVADGDKIEGFLEGWDLPPITERYTEACKQQKIVSYKNVQLLLQACEATGRLECVDMSLRSARFKPVTLAIKCQTGLRHLDIRGNRLGDLGVELLCASLATLPNLTHLGLACNNITPAGLKHLCSLVGGANTPGTDKPLQSLSSLDLGHNPLYDTCLPQLSGLVAGLTSLTRLTLTSCHLSVKLFQTNRLQLTEALHKSSLHELDISYNTLGCVGAELLLKCQNPTVVQTLDLSAILPPGLGSGSAQLYRHLYNYCTQDNCSLQSLQLCNNNLGMDDTDFLTRLPSLARNLQLLDLSGNPRLTNTVLFQLLQASSSDTSQLEQLTMTHCKLSSPLGVDLLDCLSEKLGARVPLRRLEMTCFKIGKVDSESLEQVWGEKWAELAQVEVSGQRVRLTVKDS